MKKISEDTKALMKVWTDTVLAIRSARFEERKVPREYYRRYWQLIRALTLAPEKKIRGKAIALANAFRDKKPTQMLEQNLFAL